MLWLLHALPWHKIAPNSYKKTVRCKKMWSAAYFDSLKRLYLKAMVLATTQKSITFNNMELYPHKEPDIYQSGVFSDNGISNIIQDTHWRRHDKATLQEWPRVCYKNNFYALKTVIFKRRKKPIIVQNRYSTNKFNCWFLGQRPISDLSVYEKAKYHKTICHNFIINCHLKKNR